MDSPKSLSVPLDQNLARRRTAILRRQQTAARASGRTSGAGSSGTVVGVGEIPRRGFRLGVCFGESSKDTGHFLG